MKAFKVWIPKWNDAYERDAFSIKLAESAGKARYDTLLDIRETFPSLTIMDIRVIRAPEFDNYKPALDGHSLGWKSECRNCHDVETHGVFEPVRV